MVIVESNSKNQITSKSSAHVSYCGKYIYIPFFFTIVFYIIYFLECWYYSTNNYSQEIVSNNVVYEKVRILREALPVIWWKAINYHYVRRTRHVTRYANGEARTRAQVYFERINTNIAISEFDYSGYSVKDVSYELVGLDRYPTTKIRFTKSFSFATFEAENEFEEQRERFFQQNETRDDYMDGEEGMDLLNVDFKEHMFTSVDTDNLPWYESTYIYWIASLILLSWPLRILIEYKTEYIHVHIHKRFESACDGFINEECDLLSRETTMDSSEFEMTSRNNYIMVPSYSEAILMDPIITEPPRTNQTVHQTNPDADGDIVVPIRSDTISSLSNVVPNPISRSCSSVQLSGRTIGERCTVRFSFPNFIINTPYRDGGDVTVSHSSSDSLDSNRPSSSSMRLDNQQGLHSSTGNFSNQENRVSGPAISELHPRALYSCKPASQSTMQLFHVNRESRNGIYFTKKNSSAVESRVLNTTAATSTIQRNDKQNDKNHANTGKNNSDNDCSCMSSMDDTISTEINSIFSDNVSITSDMVNVSRNPDPVLETDNASITSSAVNISSNPDPVLEADNASITSSAVNVSRNPDPVLETDNASITSGTVNVSSNPDPNLVLKTSCNNDCKMFQDEQFYSAVQTVESLTDASQHENRELEETGTILVTVVDKSHIKDPSIELINKPLLQQKEQQQKRRRRRRQQQQQQQQQHLSLRPYLLPNNQDIDSKSFIKSNGLIKSIIEANCPVRSGSEVCVCVVKDSGGARHSLASSSSSHSSDQQAAVKQPVVHLWKRHGTGQSLHGPNRNGNRVIDGNNNSSSAKPDQSQQQPIWFAHNHRYPFSQSNKSTRQKILRSQSSANTFQEESPSYEDALEMRILNRSTDDDQQQRLTSPTKSDRSPSKTMLIKETIV